VRIIGNTKIYSAGKIALIFNVNRGYIVTTVLYRVKDENGRKSC
jgi:hypothetical protein